MKFNLLFKSIFEGEENTPLISNNEEDLEKKDLDDLESNPESSEDKSQDPSQGNEIKNEPELLTSIDPIEEKLKLIAIKIFNEFNEFLKNKPDLVISKITDKGMDETLIDFIDNYYIKNVIKDPISKLYIVVNKKALISKIIEKFSDELKKKDFEKNIEGNE